MDLSVALNKKQLEAVKNITGPTLVLAGAGSGKTRALTYRIAYLINQGVNPANILTLTFTNKAAEDMEHKLKELLGEKPSDLWMGTFHGVCVRILSANLDKLGYEDGFIIYDQTESKALVSDIVTTFNLDEEDYDADGIYQIINKVKQNLWGRKDLLDHYGETDYYENIADIYEKYNETLENNNAFDFNDLIGKTIYLFKTEEEILKRYQDRFEYILIDEYQDTSFLQYKLAKMLAEEENNIFAVGDDYQSIYKFRGADMENILSFSEEFDNCKVIKLERNYRSKANIIKASNAVIANNYNQFKKKVWTDNEPGDLVTVCEIDNEHEEAAYIIDEVRRMINWNEYQYSDIAILYRSNHQSRVLEENFIRHQIPYYIVGGLGFYDRREVKDIISYLKLAVNPQDSLSLKRIVNTPKRGIGAKTIDKLISHAQEYVPEFDLFSFAEEDSNLGLFDVMEEPTQVDGVGSKTANRIKKFRRELEKIISIKESNLPLPKKVDQIIKKSGYQAMLELKDTEAAQNRLENLQELLILAENYYKKDKTRDLADFVRDLQLFSDQDDLEEENQVKMMTVHAAKGLEFPVVFIVGMEEDNFPHHRSLKTGLEEDIEEERRLCYVAMTRAEDKLYLTHARQRRQFGETRKMKSSRFLEEIPEEYKLERIYTDF